MADQDYWDEAVEIGLNELTSGRQNLLTKEEIKDLAGGLCICAENEGMMHGHDAIPNPLLSEIRDIKAAHAKELGEIEKRHDGDIGNKDWDISDRDRIIDNLRDELEQERKI